MHRRALLLSVTAGVATAWAQAESPSAAAWLRGLYGRYVSATGQAPGIELTESAIRRWFTPTLAEAILADRADAAARNEPPELNGDPFVMAQDWEIRAVEVAATADGTDRARGVVRFQNGTRPSELVIRLERIAGGWRIADIEAGGDTLTGIVARHLPLAIPPRRD